MTSVSAASSSLQTDILDFSTLPGRKNNIVELQGLAPGVIQPVISRLAIKIWRLWVKSSPTPRIHLQGEGFEMTFKSKSSLSPHTIAFLRPLQMLSVHSFEVQRSDLDLVSSWGGLFLRTYSRSWIAGFFLIRCVFASSRAPFLQL